MLRQTNPRNPVRLLELSRDDEHGHFAAISNPESKTVQEMLAMFDGVDGVDGVASPPPAPEAPQDETDEPPAGWRFPSTQSQVELDTLAPPEQPAASPREPPRYAKPSKPKRLETLELEPTARPVHRPGGPSFPRETTVDRLIRRLPLIIVVALLVGGLVAGALYYRSSRTKAPQAPSDQEVSDPSVSAPAREAQIIFKVKPPNARMIIGGQPALGHSFLAPESTKPILVRFVANGYRTEDVTVVPDKSRTVIVIMKKK